ncbi:MAG: response regulator [bacterium]|nr:response regulator [bacterium]MBU1917476.1 response regulator [bacterium]
MNIQKILVIDNDPEIVDQLIIKIEALGLEADGVTSIEQGSQVMRHATPDLIIMDLGFAQAEGYIFISSLKEALRPDEKMPPISVMNSADDQFLSTYAYDLGTTDFHVRTYDSDSLKTLIMDFLPTDIME